MNRVKLFSILSGIFLSISLSIIIFSCQNEDIMVDENFSQYELIGIEHNRGLDYVFNFIKINTEKGTAESLSTEYLLNLGKEGTREFLETSELLASDADKVIALGESNKPFAIYADFNSLKSARLNNIWAEEADNLLSGFQKEILNEIDDILINTSEIQEIVAQLTSLEEKIKNESKEEDKDILLSATAIARHSSQYWYENYDKWRNEFNPTSNSGRTLLFSWSDVGKNDIAYGVGGGIAGAIVGGSVSFGVLTLPGWAAGAIGGAVGGSVGNAILQLLN